MYLELESKDDIIHLQYKVILFLTEYYDVSVKNIFVWKEVEPRGHYKAIAGKFKGMVNGVKKKMQQHAKILTCISQLPRKAHFANSAPENKVRSITILKVKLTWLSYWPLFRTRFKSQEYNNLNVQIIHISSYYNNKSHPEMHLTNDRQICECV